jgi:hypothetical protein
MYGLNPVATSDFKQHDRLILEAIASGQRVTQRSLANHMGVALGLINLLVRRLVSKGHVKVSGIGTRHVRYLMTPKGWEALGLATRASLENTLHLYTETRERIRRGLDSVSARCPTDPDGKKRVVFYGAGDVAEIAFVSLQNTDLTLVGIVDDVRTGLFFGIPISKPAEISAGTIGGIRYDLVVVTSFIHTDTICASLHALGILDHRLCSLEAVVTPGIRPPDSLADPRHETLARHLVGATY